MEKINQELLEKAKQAKSVEELISLADQNGVKLAEEQAKAFYAKLHPTSGEMDDDELDNVAGGGCGGNSDDYDGLYVGDRVYCPNHSCPQCGGKYGVLYRTYGGFFVNCENCGQMIWSGLEPDGGIQKA